LSYFLRFFCLTLLAVGAATGQGVIEGLVVSARSGAALKNATVQLRQVGGGVSQRATTPVGGRFVFRRVTPGRYRLSAERRGYVPQEYGSPAPGMPGETLVIEAEGQPPPAVIRLSPQGVIAGRVVDEDGEPVPEVSVQALQSSPSQGSGRLVEARLARTNDLGEYRLYGLPPGRYYISAEYPVWELAASGSPGGSASYAPTYYPGASDPGAAVPLDVAPGSESLGIDFALRRASTVRLRGRVTNIPENLSPQSVSLVLMPRGLSWARGSLIKSARAEGPLGNFEIQEVVPGSYVVAAYTVGEGARHTGLQMVDIGSGDLDGVSVGLSPGADIAGRVQADGDTGRSLGGLSVFLRPRVPLPTGGFSGRSMADGTVRIEGVATGEYDVELSGVPKGCYVKSARIGGNELFGRGMEVQAGRPPGELLVLLGTDGGRVDGYVSNERQEAAPSAYVVLMPRGAHQGRNDRQRSATADHNGRFLLSDIAPGEYRLFVWEERADPDFLSPEFVDHYEAKGTDVTVRANGGTSVQLRTIR